jgi:putative ABC transport system ATP-binding protein
LSRVDHGGTRRSRLARLVHAGRDRDVHGSDYGIMTGARSGRTALDEVHVRLSRVGKTYGSGLTAVQALPEIDLEIDAGEFVVIAGPPGAGKTTLIELIGATQRPTTGQIVVGGQRLDLLDDRGRLEFRTQNVALAPQTPMLAPTLNAYETVSQAARLGCIARPDRWTRAVLAAVGLDDEVDAPAAELSDESQQRLSLARALAKGAPLFLADEPLSATSVRTRQRLLATLRRFVPARTTIVLTAPSTESPPHADRVIPL